jgi:phosphatidylglycerol:prolipoprotein diacylglycerol transferase
MRSGLPFTRRKLFYKSRLASFERFAFHHTMLPVIHIAGLELSTWRAVVFDGVVLCWILFLVRAHRLGYSFYTVFPWLLFGLPVGVLGGHLFNKLIPVLAGAGGNTYPFSGYTVIGSIFSCLVFSFFYIKYVMKAPLTRLLDAVAFTFPLSVLVGRMGCLLSGCCYGKLAPGSVKSSFLSLFTVPVGFYVEPSTAWHDFAGVPRDSLVWDLPLLLMMNALLALIAAETLYRNREKWGLFPGTVFAATSALYAGGRFLIEFLRKEEGTGNALFNPWQLAIAFLFIVSLVWLGVCMRRRSRTVSH